MNVFGGFPISRLWLEVSSCFQSYLKRIEPIFEGFWNGPVANKFLSPLRLRSGILDLESVGFTYRPHPARKNRVFWLGYSVDNTDLKIQVEKAILDEKRSLIERLAGGVAHDLNNYFASILMAAEMLSQRCADSRDLFAVTDVWVSEIKAAASISSQLLAFTKDQPVRKVVLDLREVLDEVVRFALLGSSVEVETKFDQPEVKVRADRGFCSKSHSTFC